MELLSPKLKTFLYFFQKYFFLYFRKWNFLVPSLKTYIPAGKFLSLKN